MASQWSYVWRGGLSFFSTIYLLNELTDDEFDNDDLLAIRGWIWGNAFLWGPELFGPTITRWTGLKAVPAASSVATGYALGVAATFAVIELTAPTPARKESMRESAVDLFAPQFLGGESWEELDYFGTIAEGAGVGAELIKQDLIEKKNLTVGFIDNLLNMGEILFRNRYANPIYLPWP